MSNYPLDPIANLNSIDNLFKLNPDLGAVKTGLLEAFGDSGKTTHLLTYIKNNPGDVTVTRDEHGHLSWKIGEKNIHLGSALWDRFIHKAKLKIDTEYKKNYKSDLQATVEKVTNAYNQSILEPENKAAELKGAEELAVTKQKKIKDLQTKISTGKEEIDVIRQAKIEKNTEIASLKEKLSIPEAFKKQHAIDFPPLREQFLKDAAEFKEVSKIHEKIESSSWMVSTFLSYANLNTEERKLLGDSKFGELNTPELREAKKKEFEKIEEEHQKLIDKFNGIDQEINPLKKEIERREGTIKELESHMTEKQSHLNQLKSELLELGIAYEDPINIPVNPPKVEEEPIIDEALDEEALALEKAMDGLDDHEIMLYSKLNPSDRAIYNKLRKPMEGATDCPAYADFFVSLVKDKNYAIEVKGSTFKFKALKANTIDINVEGQDAKVSLPAEFSMDYSVKDQAWTLRGKDLKLSTELPTIGLVDINLNKSTFKIEDKLKITINNDFRNQDLGVATVLSARNSYRVSFERIKTGIQYDT